MSAAVYIPLAKVMDVTGRAEGFLTMTVFATLGLILMATCHNLPTFCAAYVSSYHPPRATKTLPVLTNAFFPGVLHHWLRRNDLLCGCHHC